MGLDVKQVKNKYNIRVRSQSSCLNSWFFPLNYKLEEDRSTSVLFIVKSPTPSTELDMCCWVASVVSNSVRTHRRQPTRLPRPWDSPGKNTGVGCHFLLQFMKVKSESEVAQSCPTLSDPMDCSLPGSSVYGIFQARVLKWGAIAFSNTSVQIPENLRDAWAQPGGCKVGGTPSTENTEGDGVGRETMMGELQRRPRLKGTSWKVAGTPRMGG